MTAGSHSNVSVYDQVVRITHVYLGPAAERFIARQVENHLNKPAASLSKQDLKQLTDWLKVSISMLTEDKEIVEEYAQELDKLCKTPDGEGHS
jgi:hypothetical protein